MAYVSQGFTAYITLADNGNERSTKSYQMRAATYAAAITGIDSIVAALDAITQSSIVGYGVTHVFADDAFAVPTDTGVQNENQALVTVGIDGSPLKSATLTIPAPVNGIFVATSGANANVVDVLDADLLAYTNLFKASGAAFISEGEDLSVLKEGRRIHRGSRKG